MDREEHIVDTSVQEGNDEVASVLGRIADEEDFDALYELFSDRGPVGEYLQDQIADITGETGLHPKDDFERIEGMIMDRIQQEFGGQSNNDEGGETDDGYALASAGFGSDEDYESIETEDASSRMSMAQELYKSNPDLDSEDDILNAGFAIMKQRDGTKAARYYFSYDEDFPSDFISEYKWLQRHEHDVGEATGRDAYQRDYDSSVSGMGRRERENDEGDTEPPNNFAVSINGKQWKVFKGRGQYADDDREKQHYRQLKDWAAKKSESTGKKWTVSITGENPTESIQTEKNQSSLDSTRDRLRSQGLGSPRSSNDSDRWEKEKDSRADHTLNSIANRSKMDDARTQHEIDVLATRLKRMDRDDDDWEKTFDMMRDRMNRYQWSSQRDVDPEQLGKISDIKYDPRKKNEAAPATESMGGATDSKGRTQREWLSLVKAKFPDAKIQQAKMIDGPVQVTLPDGRKLGWSKAEKQNAMPRPAEANMKESVNTESVNTGDIMTRLQEGEVQQASAIVTAKTMVDRVSRWIEELSSMENDTLLQLGDSIRDEMGQEQAKAFISSVAPAIQQALENLKSTRETMATGVRQLTGEEQGAEMLGGEPAGMGGDEMGPAEPDAMNMGDEMGGEDEFAAAEPAAGGLGDAGREQRESINRSSSLLKVLAG
jgi:hypothetical protein